MSLISSTGTACTPWVIYKCWPSTSWPPSSYTRLNLNHLVNITGNQIPPVEPRPLKKIRTDPFYATSDLQVDDLYNLPTNFQIPQIQVKDEEYFANSADDEGHIRGPSAVQADTPEDPPLAHFESYIPFNKEEEVESFLPPLPVSPLRIPSEITERLLQDACDISLDPLYDIEMLTLEDELDDVVPKDTTSYPLVRYLEDRGTSRLSQTPSINRPDIIRSTAPIDIQTELQRLESDISDALEGMNIATADTTEAHARVSPEGSKDLAEDETVRFCEAEEDDDIFTLDGVEAVVFGPRNISSELESWISESSLIVGRSLKPLTGCVALASSNGFQEKQVHVPQGRKRKASTCQ
ncbi:hypothetical protein TWF694_009678 [Orbilia ellipsospora]|uniref:Uncharacterized protein n=1 Tax=Orbilia ellipsospora TaxID=2528407 RepID=A0AAV9XBJ0_9PEZI